MLIQIVACEKNDSGGIYIELAAEKKAIWVYVGNSYLNVCVKNAAHGVYRGSGRVFHHGDRFADAIESYKCPTVKALIKHAKHLSETGIPVAA